MPTAPKLLPGEFEQLAEKTNMLNSLKSTIKQAKEKEKALTKELLPVARAKGTKSQSEGKYGPTYSWKLKTTDVLFIKATRILKQVTDHKAVWNTIDKRFANRPEILRELNDIRFENTELKEEDRFDITNK